MNQVFAQAVVCVRDGEVSMRRSAAGPVVVYACAALGGGVAAGWALASLGAVLQRSGLGLPLAVAAITLSVAATVLQLREQVAPLPQRRAQVPRKWTLWRSRSRTAAAFGAMLGAGVFTYLHHAAAYVVGATLVLTGSVLAGVALGAIYGSTRGLTLVAAWLGPPGGSNLGPRTLAAAQTAAVALGPCCIALTVILVASQLAMR